MKFIKQKRTLDCGQAVGAMLCNITIEKARANTKNPNSGLSVNQMALLLNDCSNKTWVINSDGEIIEYSLTAVPAPTAILIKDPQDDTFSMHHWIAMENDTVHDPAMPMPLKLREYPRKHWHALRFIAVQQHDHQRQQPDAVER